MCWYVNFHILSYFFLKKEVHGTLRKSSVPGCDKIFRDSVALSMIMLGFLHVLAKMILTNSFVWVRDIIIDLVKGKIILLNLNLGKGPKWRNHDGSESGPQHGDKKIQKLGAVLICNRVGCKTLILGLANGLGWQVMFISWSSPCIWPISKMGVK